MSRLEDQRLHQLLDLTRSVVAELDVDALLRRILDVARELTGARYAALGVLDETRSELERFIVAGIDAETRREIGELPRGRGVLGVLIDDPRPLRLADVGQHPRSYGFPPGHPPMHTFLGVPVLIRGEAYGNLYLTDKADGEFTAADEEALVLLAGWAGIAIDNARVHQSLKERNEELERAVRAFEATADIARAVGGEIELPRVLELIVKRGRAVIEARSVLLLLREGDELVVAAAAGEASRAVGELRVPLADSVAGDVFRTRRPERLPDVSARLRALFGALTDATSELIVPVLHRNRSLGVIIAVDRLKDGPEFTAEDERILVAFAASAATGIATAQNAAARGLRLSLEAAEQERRKWARELHDETLQELGALRILLSAARRTGDLEPAVTQALERISHGIEELRALITELRPAALDELGVGPAIVALVERTRRHTPATITLELDLAHERGAPSRLDPQTESVVYRVVQEALTNAIRHGTPQQIGVRVVEEHGSLSLVVRDDGSGFDPEADTEGFGLIGMAERATLGGGRLEVESAPGRGTIVRAMLPATYREPPGTAAALGA